MPTSPFSQDQIINIPFLSEIRGLDSSEFIVEELFFGGMGLCIKIRHLASLGQFALKTIQKEFLEDENAWLMFVEEMKTWVTLSACDGVAEAFCLVRINEIPYVCSEWMVGGDLNNQIKNQNPNFFFTNVIRIARTLEWVNTNHSIIHRDLKPGNILLDRLGLTYLADWGLAKPIANAEKLPKNSQASNKDSSRPNLTRAGEMKGTITYASPEQIEGKLDIDHRSDIYSFGCVLYKWVTGLPPFVADTANEIAVMHLCHPVPSLKNSYNYVDLGIDEIISKCLEKEPSNRYQTYETLVNDLLKVARTHLVDFEPYVPHKRYSMPKIGDGEYQKHIDANDITYIRSPDRKHLVIDFDDAKQFLREADALTTIGEWQKAAQIYGSFFVPEMISEDPDDEWNQGIAINYANCLIQLDKASDAISVFAALEDANAKSATYFVNLSLAYIHTHQYKESERTSRIGLAIFENDKDILGNLVISLIRLC